jgi:hypothetical protein
MRGMHTALHHRIAVPSWVVASMLAIVVAIGAIALFAGSDSSSTIAPAKAAAPTQEMPTSCVDAAVVGHC